MIANGYRRSQALARQMIIALALLCLFSSLSYAESLDSIWQKWLNGDANLKEQAIDQLGTLIKNGHQFSDDELKNKVLNMLLVHFKQRLNEVAAFRSLIMNLYSGKNESTIENAFDDEKDLYDEVRKALEEWHTAEVITIDPDTLVLKNDSTGMFEIKLRNRLGRKLVTEPSKATVVLDDSSIAAVELSFITGKLKVTPRRSGKFNLTVSYAVNAMTTRRAVAIVQILPDENAPMVSEVPPAPLLVIEDFFPKKGHVGDRIQIDFNGNSAKVKSISFDETAVTPQLNGNSATVVVPDGLPINGLVTISAVGPNGKFESEYQFQFLGLGPQPPSKLPLLIGGGLTAVAGTYLLLTHLDVNSKKDAVNEDPNNNQKRDEFFKAFDKRTSVAVLTGATAAVTFGYWYLKYRPAARKYSEEQRKGNEQPDGLSISPLYKGHLGVQLIFSFE